ncbi:uncharacterized protein A4U43_C01F1770 [Asparagus officinalis]|uniref:Thiol-disulfide oxudoreductase DCC n=1 Tax=Asparagus officinalis TaxID=4686 RepID=A0A5P1FMM6_ASPOF|nr:uncharacterized protein A4U43_C01F1770 [Asparagus officinalis]
MALRAAANRLPLYRPLCSPPPPPSPIRSPLRVTCSPRNPSPVFRCQVATDSNPKIESVAQSKGNDRSSNGWRIKMLYDGDCPLCMREVNMLKERNESYKAIKFVDISSDEYTPEENQGLDYETVMGKIHAIESDGTVVTDVEAFRRLYEEVGLGWIYAITKYEPIATVANSVYSVWAKYRLQITGRPPLDNILEARKKKMGQECSNDKTDQNHD